MNAYINGKSHLNYQPTFDQETFTKDLLNKILTHYNQKFEFDVNTVMAEIYNDLYPAKG